MDQAQYLVSSVKITFKSGVLLSMIKYVGFVCFLNNSLGFFFATMVNRSLLFLSFVIFRFSLRLPEKEVSHLFWQSLMESLGLDSRNFQWEMLLQRGMLLVLGELRLRSFLPISSIKIGTSQPLLLRLTGNVLFGLVKPLC